MLDKNQGRFNRQYDRLAKVVPAPLARLLRWIRHPYARLVRLPLGVLLVLGGIFSILPLLGLWMLPVGLLLLAVDIPFLRGPVASAIIRVRRWWENRTRK